MNLPWYTHSTLQRFLRIDISIINDEALRIGVGRAAPLKAVDLPVVTIRLPKGNMPYIPGSSLKGVIRSTCEFIAKSSGIEGVCMAGACGNKFADPEQEVTYHAAIDRALRSNDHQGVIEILARYCLICKAFGSSSFG
ncbi:MAG: RAMP superfamily CRISPR-associated protein, partial [Nitrososphaerota archaeon]